ncbi:PREDICTED: transcription factor AP-4 [Colobus angolensis palliatus]|uniref:transcription factor AP-4 n=1 Tax=Colobus angolensis palliatus TaxID=336983 RepID=UPI0005F494D6|nr:PREDICTED: transcription factor AP-4 [Colobus angolensis palliatus]
MDQSWNRAPREGPSGRGPGCGFGPAPWRTRPALVRSHALASSLALFPLAAFAPHWSLLLQGSVALPTAWWEPRFSSTGLANIPLTPETQRDQERRIRREIANSNERRRMQSINAGFQSLKTLIPHTDGEKLSKAAILQQTAEYIFSLEQEKTRLLQQNTQLKRFIQELSGSSPKRRRAEDKDEGIGSPDIWEDEKAEDLRREMIELRQQLDKERSVRMMLEEQVRSLEAHMYPEKLKVIAQQVQLQQQQEQVRLLHQEKLEREQQHLRTQLLPPPAPTHHPTVIVPAPPPPASHHINVVTMGPSSVINSVSTSRQNLDTIVQKGSPSTLLPVVWCLSAKILELVCQRPDGSCAAPKRINRGRSAPRTPSPCEGVGSSSRSLRDSSVLIGQRRGLGAGQGNPASPCMPKRAWGWRLRPWRARSRQHACLAPPPRLAPARSHAPHPDSSSALQVYRGPARRTGDGGLRALSSR